MKQHFFFILFGFQFATAQKNKTDFSISLGYQSNMLHSPRFQQLLSSKDIAKIGGKIGNGMFLGGKFDFSNFNINARVFKEGFDLTNSNYLAKDFPVVLRGYEAGVNINLFPRLKFLKLFTGLSYLYSAIGGTEVRQNTASNTATLSNSSFTNSVNLSFPSINISLQTKREGILNFFIEGSQPLNVQPKTFSKISIGLLLF
jgi:hypothetical protein